MAAPTQGPSRPGRTLAVLGLIVVALGVWTFWPGLTNTPKLGLDLRGGTQVILTPSSADSGAEVTDDQLKQAVEIIRQRVDGFGVAESEVTTQGSGQNASIIVSIPGVTNQAILDSLATTAKLDFRPVINIDYGAPQPTPTASGSAAPSPSASASGSRLRRPSASASGNGAAVTGGLRPAAGTASPSPSAARARRGRRRPPTPSSRRSRRRPTTRRCRPRSSPSTAPREGATKGGPADPKKYIATCATDGSLKYLLDPAAVQGTEISSASGRSVPERCRVGGQPHLHAGGVEAVRRGDRPARAAVAAAEPVRDHPRRPRAVGAVGRDRDHRRQRRHHRLVHRGRGQGAGQRAQVRLAAGLARGLLGRAALADAR